jgi:hypothetical protein
MYRTSESVQYGIDTTVVNYPSFVSSLNKEYSSSGESFSGTRIPVFTTIVPFDNGETMTAYGYYHSSVLAEAGYRIVSSITTVTSCVEETATLPPSPTGSVCEPHGDHCTCPRPGNPTRGEPSDI